MPDHDPDATRVRSDDAPAPHPEGVRPSDAPAPDPNATLVRPPADPARLPFVAGRAAVPGFEIEGTLGRGGMGVVYRARQTGLNRPVALKMLLAGSFADPDVRARFLLEAESVAALEHPHIVRVFAFGEAAGHPYLAMEFAPGGTLAERIKARGHGQERLALKGHTESVRSVCFSPHGTRVLPGSDDKTAKGWETDTGQEQRRRSSHQGAPPGGESRVLQPGRQGSRTRRGT